MSAPRTLLAHQWMARETPANLRHALTGFFARHGMKIERDDGAAVQLTQGSQLRTRLLGGWFVAPRHFPKRAFVRITPAPAGGSWVEACIQEDLGVGLLDPLFASRYEEYFRAWMAELVQLLA